MKTHVSPEELFVAMCENVPNLQHEMDLFFGKADAIELGQFKDLVKENFIFHDELVQRCEKEIILRI